MAKCIKHAFKVVSATANIQTFKVSYNNSLMFLLNVMLFLHHIWCVERLALGC